MSVSRAPKYSRQREAGRSDRAYVRIGGKRIKLGIYGSSESRQRYDELIKGDNPIVTHPAKRGRQLATSPSVNKLLVAFLEHARTYYQQPDGRARLEVDAGKDKANPFEQFLSKRMAN